MPTRAHRLENGHTYIGQTALQTDLHPAGLLTASKLHVEFSRGMSMQHTIWFPPSQGQMRANWDVKVSEDTFPFSDNWYYGHSPHSV